MKDVLYLAWRYLRYNRVKTAVLVASISLILFLPAAMQVLVRQAARVLTARADATPLLVGARGSDVDLTLAALYFREPTLPPLHYREVERIDETGLAVAIPLNLRYSAGGQRIVGTTPEYFDFRRLRVARGRKLAILGECVLGAHASELLGAEPGDDVLSTPAGAFDVGGSFPLKMKVVGVLAPSGTVDDDVVFADVKTTWVIAGIAHGHSDVTAPSGAEGVLSRTQDNVVAKASVLPYTEITPENIDSFHFHGNQGDFPVDAAIVVPPDRKAGIVLRGRFAEDDSNVQILVPRDVVDDLVETMFSVQNAVFLVTIGLGLATIATVALVFALSVRLRRREIETIRKIGGPRSRLVAILSAEVLLVVVASLAVAAGLTALVSRFGAALLQAVAG